MSLPQGGEAKVAPGQGHSHCDAPEGGTGGLCARGLEARLWMEIISKSL